jgi:hypothetical protein
MWKPKTIAIVTGVALLGFIGVLTESPESAPVASQTQQASETTEPRSTPTATSSQKPEPGSAEFESSEPEPTEPESTEPESTEPESTEPESTETPEVRPSPAPSESGRADQAPASEELVGEEGGSSEEVDRFTFLLASMKIEPEVTSGYDRSLFKHWIDADGDSCNAREEVLIIESLEPVTLGAGCKVLTGRWLSNFDGVVITDSSKLDMDHMVPLKEAWDSGANTWSASRRQAFANDIDLPEALIAVSASSNRSKSARDPAEWLPTNLSYRCQYVEDWMAVKVKWELSVDAKEFEALRSVSVGCVN